MKEQFKYGRWRFVVFRILDLFLLILANYLAAAIYLTRTATYGFQNYYPVVLIMLAIDLAVDLGFNTSSRVLRRNLKKEITRGGKHVLLSFIALSVILFSTRSGSVYSRVTVFLSYGIYYLLYIVGHVVCREIMKRTYRKTERKTAFLMTTDRFVTEGLEELSKLHIDVRGIWLLKNLKKDEIQGIPVAGTWEEAASAICWQMLDRVYIYGLDHQMVPQYLIKACREMGLAFNLVDFNYRVIEIETIKHPDPKFGELTFLEGKRDIPFPIRRVYWITQTEAEAHRGFHAHKLNCQLLWCPYGKIDMILDDGEQRTTVTLDRPGKGLILMPGLWREMVWKEDDSVLCVLASEYYDAEEYIRDYQKFLDYSKKYRENGAAILQ